MNQETYINYGKIAITILIVVALGLFVMNQMTSWVYKVQILGGPCKLCLDSNPQIKQCLEQSMPENVLGVPKINLSNFNKINNLTNIYNLS